MADRIVDGEASGLTRRGLLGAGAVVPLALAGSAVIAAEPAHDMAMHGAAPAEPTPGAAVELEGLETLNATEMEALEAICARLIPSEEGSPGAKEARAAHYIDRSLAGPLMGQRTAYAIGLSTLDAYARETKGQLFARLEPADQDALLHDMEAGKAPGLAAFFATVRTHTIEGTFCDPYYGGNADFVGWDLVGYPGLRMMVGPEDQRFEKPRTLRQSAYSAAVFGRRG